MASIESGGKLQPRRRKVQERILPSLSLLTGATVASKIVLKLRLA